MGKSFFDFVDTSVKKGANVNAQPRGRQTSQPGVDAVNQAIKANSGNAFDDVESVLSGNTTARQARRPMSAGDLCDAIVPPNNVVSSAKASLAVSISPNSWNNGGNQTTAPLLITIAAFGATVPYEPYAQFNTSRTRLMIQNLGSGNLFIVFGKASQFNADITTKYHMKIAAGQTYFDDQWQGRIDVASDSGTQFTIIEFTRAQNVSQ
jgi:hypothetical protein